MKSTWRFVLKIVGVSLALAGIICLLVGCWESLMAGSHFDKLISTSGRHLS